MISQTRRRGHAGRLESERSLDFQLALVNPVDCGEETGEIFTSEKSTVSANYIVHVHGMGVERQIPYFAVDFVENKMGLATFF